MYSNSLKRIPVDFALLSTSQEKKVRFGETKLHPQDRGPGILFGGFNHITVSSRQTLTA